MEVDVIVIGGGVTGAGVARDCARRGLSCILIERRDLATGATGRNHGLLHSGARYAVTDLESAEECIEENRILRRIARHCVEDSKGVFITLPEDDLAYQDTFINACTAAGIPTERIEPKEALKLEPAVNPALTGAIIVPDGVIDPFRLTVANTLDAGEHGAVCFTYHEVIALLQNAGRVAGVSVRNNLNGEVKNLYAKIVVNAAGIWGQHIAELAGVTVRMFPTRGALLILGHRINNMVINRCRKPADADILVPGDTVSLIGTTSTPIDYKDLDNMVVSKEEVDVLMREGAMLAPRLLNTRKLRVYAGARPLVADDADPTGRNISRRIVLLDHATRDGLEGFITISGGKLITYRLMAELATDLICKKLSVNAPCTTAEAALPGSREAADVTLRKVLSMPHTVRASVVQRHGELAQAVNAAENQPKLASGMVCECESVSVGEVKHAIDSLAVRNLIDLRRRTRVGMGTCQGELCSCRAAGLLARYKVAEPPKVVEQLEGFLQERWKGIRPLAWGDALRESEFTVWLYQGTCGLQGKGLPKSDPCRS